MSSITNIESGDLITNSRADINGNFTALNNEKIETSVLDTDTTLSANSDDRIPTQRAVKAYTDSGGNVNATETTKGIVEIATAAEVAAGSATGSTGATLAVSPDNLPTATVMVPLPSTGWGGYDRTIIDDTTTAHVALFSVPYQITVNKISIISQTVSTGDTLDLTLYSEDGQTQIFSVTTASVSASSTVYTTAVSSVSISPGNYYFMVNANSGTPNLGIYGYTPSNALFANSTTGTLSDISTEPVLAGTVTITAGTPPATITPSGITVVKSTSTTGRPIALRLDN